MYVSENRALPHTEALLLVARTLATLPHVTLRAMREQIIIVSDLSDLSEEANPEKYCPDRWTGASPQRCSYTKS